MTCYEFAVREIERGSRWHEGVAYLVHALTLDPHNAFAAAMLHSTILMRGISQRTCPLLMFQPNSGALSADFSPDGSKVIAIENMFGPHDRVTVWDASDGELLASISHGAGVSIRSARFSADGNRIVTAGDDGVAMVWDASDGASLMNPLSHTDVITRADFSSDSKLIVTSSLDGSSKIWSAATGDLVAGPFSCSGKMPVLASLSPLGDRLVLAQDKKIHIFDVGTGRQIAQLGNGRTCIEPPQFSPSGERILTVEKAGNSVIVQVWEATTGRPIGRPVPSGDREYRSDNLEALGHSHAAWGPSEEIVVVTRGKTALIWNFARHQVIGQPLNHEDEVVEARFNLDGSQVLTASWDKTARIWDSTSGQMIGALPHREGVTSARFSADGKRVVTAGWDSCVRTWDSTVPNAVFQVVVPQKDVVLAQFNLQGTRMLTVSKDGLGQVWDPTRRKRVGSLLTMGLPANIRKLHLSSDGKRVLALVENRRWKVWDVEDGREIAELLREFHPSEIGRFSEDNRVDFMQWGKVVAAWDLISGEVDRAETGGSGNGHVVEARLMDCGVRVLTMTSLGHFELWNILSGRRLRSGWRLGDGGLGRGHLSNDGRYVAVLKEHYIEVLDVMSGVRLGRAIPTQSGVECAVLSTGGELVATYGHRLRELRVWNTMTGEQVGQPMPHGDQITDCRFSPEGDRIFVTEGLGMVRVWKVRTGQPAQVYPSIGTNRIGAVFFGANKALFNLAHGSVWDLCSKRQVFDSQGEGVLEAKMSLNGARMMLLGRDNAVRVLDVSTAALMGKAVQHGQRVAYMGFNTDGSRGISIASDGKLGVWDINSGSWISHLLDLKDGNQRWEAHHSIQDSTEDGALIGVDETYGDGQRLSVRCARFNKEVQMPDGEELLDARISQDGSRVLSYSEVRHASRKASRRLRVWDASSGQPLGEALTQTEEVDCFQFTSAETVISVSGGVVRQWHVESVRNEPVPSWVLRFATAIAGCRIGRNGRLESVPESLRISILHDIPRGDDEWCQLARQARNNAGNK